MKKISIIGLHLNYGGCEKAICSLANSLSDIFDVEIISLYKIDKPAFKINKKIKITYLMDAMPRKKEWFGALKKLHLITFVKESYNNTKVLFFLRKQKMISAIKKCDSDIIISTKASINKKLGKYGKSKALKIGWEHNHHHDNLKYANKVTDSAKKLDYLVLVSKELQKYYEKELKTYKCECIYIPNSLDETPKSVSKLSNHNLISIGRLSPEKGFSDLIDVFKIVNEKQNDWHLNIFGDGSEKEKLENKINNLNLNNNITLHGFKDKETINKYLKESSIYVMTSFTESFGIVVLEAMSYGIPVIAFDSAKGVLELIENDNNGYLIPNRDKEAMAQQIIALINYYNKRIEMGLNGYKKSLNYSTDLIKEKWLSILERN